MARQRARQRPARQSSTKPSNESVICPDTASVLADLAFDSGRGIPVDASVHLFICSSVHAYRRAIARTARLPAQRHRSAPQTSVHIRKPPRRIPTSITQRGRGSRASATRRPTARSNMAARPISPLLCRLACDERNAHTASGHPIRHTSRSSPTRHMIRRINRCALRLNSTFTAANLAMKQT